MLDAMRIAGEVVNNVPMREAVVEARGDVQLPDACPSCGQPLTWQNDFLKCTNQHCRAQIEQRISHWFRILGNADWFGIKTIEKLVEAGYDSLEKIYAMTESDQSQVQPPSRRGKWWRRIRRVILGLLVLVLLLVVVGDVGRLRAAAQICGVNVDTARDPSVDEASFLPGPPDVAWFPAGSGQRRCAGRG